MPSLEFSTVAETQTTHIDSSALWRILDVARELARAVDLDTLLLHVIDAAREVLNAERGTVFLYDEDTHELFVKVATGLDQVRFPATRGIAGQCATDRCVINVQDCYADDRFNREVDRKTGYRTHCMLTVPLIGYEDELVGVMQVLNKQGGVFSEQDERIAEVLAAQCAVALQRARLLEEFVEKQKLERDLELARQIQCGVLPKRMPTVNGYDLAGWSRAADQTGGDIYDLFRMAEGQVLLLLADATGHGVGPAISVTQMRAMVRMAARLKADLDAMFAHINDQLTEDLAANRFITAFIGILDAERHVIDYHAGGQGPLLVYHADSGKCDELPASALPMGIMSGLAGQRPEPITLNEGDIFVLISDGFLEAQNEAGNQFGAEHVELLIHENQNLPMAELVEKLVKATDEYVGDAPQADDMTVLLVRRLPA